MGEYKALVKYFHSVDEKTTVSLLKSTEAFFLAKGCPIQLHAVQAQASTTTPPLELWLSHSCKQ